MRAGIIINPIAGGRRHDADGSARASRARDAARRSGVEAEVHVTRRPGEAIVISGALLERGATRIVAWGGDGTANEVAAPLIGSAAEFGLVPGGSGDGLARSLDLPRHPDAALALALGDATTAIDVGYLGDRHFLNIAGIGFDAVVAHAFNRRGRRGLFDYVRGSLTAVWRYQPASYRIDLDAAGPGRVALDERACFVIAFANGRQYGNGLTIAPQADLRDGRLEAVVVAAGAPWRQFWRARRLFVRRLAPAEGVVRRSVTQARVIGEALVCHVDGESFETAGAIEVRVAAGALRVAAPLRNTTPASFRQ